MNITLTVDEPKHKVGEQFTYRYGKQKHTATITGYRFTHNTEANKTEYTYNATYPFLNQTMHINVARATVDMHII